MLSGLALRADAGTSRRRACEGQHALPDRRARRRPARRGSMPASRWTRSRASEIGQAHAARVARAGASSRRETAGACDVGFACAYTNTISWRSADDAAADGEQSARGVRTAVRRQRQHRSRRRGCARIAAGPQRARLGDRGSRAPAGRARRERSRQAGRVPRRHSRRRAAHPEGRGAERPGAAGRRPAGGHPGHASTSTSS